MFVHVHNHCVCVMVLFLFYSYSSIIDSNLIGTLSNILEKITKCESRPETWELLTLIYATIMLVVSSMRKNEGKQSVLCIRLYSILHVLHMKLCII